MKAGVLVHPSGPSLYYLLEVMGKEKVIGRIERALGVVASFQIEKHL